MKRWLFLISLGIAGAFIIRSFLFEGIYIATPSMEPTLPVGMNIFVEKITLYFRDFERREIIVFTPPVPMGKEMVKRIIGLPGETIEIKDKQVFINGKFLEEPYAQFKRKDEILVGDNIPAMEIPKDSYFVMGDNRDESGDSRDWKSESGEHFYFINKKNIKGRLLNTLE
jgi:signal peptidase I